MSWACKLHKIKRQELKSFASHTENSIILSYTSKYSKFLEGFMDDNAEAIDRKTSLIVTKNSGKILGNINRVFIDPNRKKISAFSFRKKYLGKEFFLEIDQIDDIGEDVVFVRSELSAKPLTKAEQPLGQDLLDFQGIWVFTQTQEPIAAVIDLGFDRKTYDLNVLYFCDQRALSVNAMDVHLSQDKIIVPANMASKIIDPGQSQGLLAGLFGKNIVNEAAIVLQRALLGLSGQLPNHHKIDGISM